MAEVTWRRLGFVPRGCGLVDEGDGVAPATDDDPDDDGARVGEEPRAGWLLPQA
jgi:hypothetical protein